MKPRTYTAEQIAARVTQRPPGYLDEIAPALLRTFDDGSVEYDTAHPAFVAARKKYGTAPRAGGCSGCGGKSLTDLRANPAAMEAALAE